MAKEGISLCKGRGGLSTSLGFVGQEVDAAGLGVFPFPCWEFKP